MKTMKSIAKDSALNRLDAAFSRLRYRLLYNLKFLGFEGTIWVLALFYLAFFVNPGETHLTICPLANIGIDYCPGCGLGNSISYIFNGEIINSFNSHPLGLLAVSIILYRIISIYLKNRRRNG
jgi:hypothetical protein